MKTKVSSPTGQDMRKYGRNLARAMNQTHSLPAASKKTAPMPYAVGDAKFPAPEVMKHGDNKVTPPAEVAVNGSPKKATKIRGTGAATKGTMARGPMG